MLVRNPLPKLKIGEFLTMAVRARGQSHSKKLFFIPVHRDIATPLAISPLALDSSELDLYKDLKESYTYMMNDPVFEILETFQNLLIIS